MREAKGGCYRIRNVPLDDRLIYMDADLTEDCPQDDCEDPNTFIF